MLPLLHSSSLIPETKNPTSSPWSLRIPYHPLQVHTRYVNQSLLHWAAWDSHAGYLLRKVANFTFHLSGGRSHSPKLRSGPLRWINSGSKVFVYDLEQRWLKSEKTGVKGCLRNKCDTAAAVVLISKPNCRADLAEFFWSNCNRVILLQTDFRWKCWKSVCQSIAWNPSIKPIIPIRLFEVVDCLT